MAAIAVEGARPCRVLPRRVRVSANDMAARVEEPQFLFETHSDA
jgi:hypothetical protein